MSTLSITFKDIQILLKNRGNVIMLFLMPMIFIVIFSGALASLGNSQPEDKSIPLPVVALDSGQTAQDFLSRLGAARGVKVQMYDAAEADILLNDKKIMRILTIPADFTAKLAQSQPTQLRLVLHANAPVADTHAVQLVIDGVLQEMVLEQQILLSLEQMGAMNAGASPEVQTAFGTERLKDQAKAQFIAAQANPLVTVVQRLAEQANKQEKAIDAADTAAPASIIMFVFLTAQTMATSIFQEKKVGSFRRLLAAPISKAALLTGKMLPIFLIGLGQVVILFAFGSFGMKLMGMKAMSLGNDILGLAVVCVLLALCSSALGIVIASLARTEGQITGLSTLLLWGMGMVSFVPAFLLQKTIGPVVNVIPHYWAKDALENLLLRGLSLGDITTPIAALAVFTVLFFAVGLWRFDFD